jgi:hypothetical protein
MMTTADTISSVSGTPDLTITPTGAKYWNLSNYIATSDWGQIAQGYQLFRIREIKVVVSRLVSETVLSTVYPNGIANIHIAFYPINASFTPLNASIVQTDNSMRISAFSNKQYSKVFKLPNMLSTRIFGGVDYTTNPSQWTSTSQIGVINGCFCVAAASPGNAVSTANLFAIETFAMFDLCCPY